jgi:hypothetical protein
MFDLVGRPCRAVASRLDLWRWRTKDRGRRLSRAWRYFIGRLSADDAQNITLDCRYAAGWHPLLVLTVEDTLEQARETLADHPELPRLIADGCARVGDKWESHNGELYEARCWAIDLAEDYAAVKGMMLVGLDDDAATEGDVAESDPAEGGKP